MSELEQLKADLATLEADTAKSDEFLSRAQAARALGVAPETMSRLAERNNLQKRRIKGHRRYWFRKADIMSLMLPIEESELAKRPVLEEADALLQEMERHKAATADHLREKLAELTTIANAIPPACPDAQALVQARIDSVKREMHGNG